MNTRSSNSYTFALLGLIGTVGLVACASEDASPAASPAIAIGPPTTTPGQGGTSSAGGASSSSGTGADDTVGELEPVWVPDTPCAAPKATPVDLLPDPSEAPLFRRLVRVDDGWIAGEGSGLPGFVPFDAVGAGAELPPVVLSEAGERLASEGAFLGAAAFDAGSAVYQRYDAFGAPAGDTANLGPADAQVSPQLAGGDDEALVVWGDEGRMVAHSIQGGVPMATSFDLGSGGYTSSAFIAMVYDAGAYGVAWSAFDGVTHTTYFARADSSGVLVEPREVWASSTPHRVVRIAATTSGYAVLAQSLPDGTPQVLLLDATGASLDGQIHQLEGAFYGWDLVSRGDDLALLAVRATGEPELRLFDSELVPQGDWVCLGEAGELTSPGALAADEEGYAAVLYQPTTLDPAEEGPVFLRLDSDGR